MTTNGTVTARKRHFFADGGQVRLDLPEGEWVLVRRELTYGQQRRLAAAGVTGIDQAAAAGDRLRVDLAAYEIERLATWVLDWSLVDADGAPVEVSREAIEALHPDTAAEINAALETYIEAEAAKKAPAAPGTTAPGATSPSAARSAGPGSS